MNLDLLGRRTAFACLGALLLSSCGSAGGGDRNGGGGGGGTKTKVTLAPSPLNIGGVGSTFVSTLTATDPNYTGTLSMTTTCASGTSPIASVSPSSGNGPTLAFKVTPQNIGSCAVTVSDSNGATSTATVNVAVKANKLALTPTTLSLGGAGAAYAGTLTASDPSYTGVITVTTTCAAGTTPVATIAPTSGNGPTLAITVTPQNAGSCTVTATDTTGATATSTVNVTTGGVTVQ